MTCTLCGHPVQYDNDTCCECEALITELAQYLLRAKRVNVKQVEHQARGRATELQLEIEAINFDAAALDRDVERYVRGE